MDTESFRDYKTFIFLGSLALFLFYEIKQSKKSLKEYLSSTSSIKTALWIGLINIVLIALIFGSSITDTIQSRELKPEGLGQLFIQSLSLLLIMDLYTYFWHRLNHKSIFLWRFHEIHHLDKTLNSFSAVRFHFGEIFLSTSIRLALFQFLPISIMSYFVFEVFYLLANIFAHSNIQLNYKLEKILNRIIVTPRFHRIHHHPSRRLHDTNFSTVFSFWDRIFKTETQIQEEDSFLFGVENQTPPKSFFKLLIRPFKTRN